MRESLITILTVICILAISEMTIAGMEKDPSKKPTIHRPSSRLERDMRKSAASGKWK
ncbi:MAG: hypothetical protein NTX26_01330 [Candidatus Parcubacteria bacterium]|nr:hypothetical protein [Candidatus Parcubacteria bacterium]